ncbi:MAG: TRAP transporter substrate-binding protein DctP [Enhydrobacter sp.]|nr:TRAP transporter substrate-binding protein DctP [Enhydrobacter sp.]
MPVSRIAAAIAAVVFLAGGTAGAQQTVRTATSWPGGPHLEQFAQGFSKQVDSLTGGKLKFQIFPAGTIGSPLKITESVQKKVAPAGHTWSGYDWGIDKTAAIFGGYVGSPPAEALLHWIYAGGGIDMWRQWRMEKFGVVGMPCGSHSDEIHMHSRKPVRTLEDLKGLKLRTSGAWAEIANSLGASTVILAGGEVYPALERGVVDAIEWATPGINYSLGFHKVAKYVILPGVHQPGAVLECIFDKALWDGFDPTTKKLVEAAAKLSTIESWMNINMMDIDALEKLKADGVEIIRVDQGYVDGVAKATREWEDKYIAAEGGWFKKVVESQRAFMVRWKGSTQYRSEFR